MKKEYKKPLIEMVDFVPEDDIMVGDEDDDFTEPDFSMGYDEW